MPLLASSAGRKARVSAPQGADEAWGEWSSQVREETSGRARERSASRAGSSAKAGGSGGPVRRFAPVTLKVAGAGDPEAARLRARQSQLRAKARGAARAGRLLRREVEMRTWRDVKPKGASGWRRGQPRREQRTTGWKKALRSTARLRTSPTVRGHSVATPAVREGKASKGMCYWGSGLLRRVRETWQTP